MTALVGAAQQIEASNCEPPATADTDDALLLFDEDGDDVEESNRSALAASHGHPGVSKGEWARAHVAEVRAPVERQKQAEELRGALLHVRRLQAEVRSLKSKVRSKVAKPTR